MRIIKIFIVMLLMGVLLSSCLTVQVVPIDQMEPGKVDLPEQIRRIAFLSGNFKFDIDTLGNYYNDNFRLKKAPENENKRIDSIAVVKSFESLRNILLESGRFDEIAVYPYSTISPQIGKDALPLSSQYIKKLCDDSGSDAIVSLDMLSYFYSRNSGNPRMRIPKEAELKINAIWAVYRPGKEVLIDRFKYSDVIKWYENSQTGDVKKLMVPSRIEGIELGCGIAAKNYSRRLVPYWTKSERILVGLEGTPWEEAMSFAQKYKWEKAAELWDLYKDSNNKRTRGAAALDLAVANEMQGNYDKAAYWSGESLKWLTGGELKQIATDYSGLLKSRRIKTEKMNRILK